jgi:Fe-S-cluster containining protein
MPAHAQSPSPGVGTVEFTLKVQNARLQVRAELPEGPVRPAVLLPILQNLSDSMAEIAVQSAAQLGETLSCREGCGACCRQAVPITPVEALALADWLEEQPEERRAVLRERFHGAAARLEEAGIAQQIRASGAATGSGLSRETAHELGLRYFGLGLACPFLEEERCTIHAIRPLRCREYLVVSPAEHCAHPATKEVVGIKPPVLLSQILARWDANGDPQPRPLILLALLEEWIAEHPAEEDRAHRTSPELLKEFLQAFAQDASAAPADPRAAQGPDILS